MQLFVLVSNVLLIGATQASSITLVTYFSPKYSVAINSSIVIVSTAAIEVCSQFIKD